MQRLLAVLKNSLRRMPMMITKKEEALSPLKAAMMLEKPIVVVCGCTGTGKSDLGIALAEQFNGEVISADSMQIYKGLDIVTNKVKAEEMRGVPHHMMSFLEPFGPNRTSYHVHHFRNTVVQLLERMWGEGKLPVIVGGTAYYMESILWDNIIPSPALLDDSNRSSEIRDRLLASHPSNDELYEELQRVDPEWALQVHRNDRYRVLRALEIFYVNGKRKSDILKEQKSQGLHLGGKLRYKNTLLINLDADKEVLDQRLFKRVDKMIARGFRQEIEQFYDENREQLLQETHGILQSIGLKEFIPYLQLPQAERTATHGELLFAQGCNLLKIHTTQYSRKQRNWVKHRIFHRSSIREVPQLLNLDASCASAFFERVVPFAVEYVRTFLAGADTSALLSSTADAPLFPIERNPELAKQLSDDNYDLQATRIYYCETCQQEIQATINWKRHLAGKRHKKMLSKLAEDAALRKLREVTLQEREAQA